MNTAKLLIVIVTIALFTTACGSAATPAPTAAPTQPAPAAFPVTVTDDAGRMVTIKAEPQRIVSLAPSNTEILFALGLGQRVVGVDDFSDYPPEAASIEKVGGLEPNKEKIVSLAPDLILAVGGSPAQIEKAVALEKLGLAVLVLDPANVEGVIKNIELVGQATGQSNTAGKLAAELRARVKAVADKTANAPKPKVFFELDATDPTKPFAPGPGSFIDGMITLAGGANIAANAQMQWVQLSAEEIIAQNPDVIVLSDAEFGVSPESVKARPGWDVIAAVKNGAVYPIGANAVSRPGPRIVDGLEELARLIHPELFK